MNIIADITVTGTQHDSLILNVEIEDGLLHVRNTTALIDADMAIGIASQLLSKALEAKRCEELTGEMLRARLSGMS